MADKEIRKDNNCVHEFASDELENVSGGDKLVKITNGEKEVVRKGKVPNSVVPVRPSSQPAEIEKL